MTILILDDEPVIRDVLQTVLGKAGFDTVEADSAAAGLARLARDPVDLLLLDLMLPDRPGLEVLTEVRQRWHRSCRSSSSPPIPPSRAPSPRCGRGRTTTSRSRSATTRSSTWCGQALEKRRLLAENRELKARLDGTARRSRRDRRALRARWSGSSRRSARRRPPARRSWSPARAAPGKELVARALHRLSPRASGPFVTVHSGAPSRRTSSSRTSSGTCAAPFTGAVADKKGLFKVGRRGHDLLRRDRHGPARDAGEAPARPAGARVPAGRRHRARARRRARRRGHERRPRRGSSPRGASARTSTTASASSRSRSRRCASGRRTCRSSSRRSSRGPPRRTARPVPLRHPGGDEGAPRPRLARQRPRARERPRASPRPRPRASSTSTSFRTPCGAPCRAPAALPAEGLSFKDAVDAYERSLLSAALQRAARRPEERGRAPPPQADDAERDAQAPRHAAEGTGERGRRRADDAA